MTKTIHLDIDHLREKIEYDSDTGILTWRDNFFKTKIGKEIGCVSQYGYRKVTYGGATYLCHRVAWALHHNEQPPEVIDHKNGDRLDNRIKNLRASSPSHNAENMRSANSRNQSSIYLGVSKFEGRWRAKIKAGGKYIFLGYHATEIAARDAYIEAKRKYHKGCQI